MAFDPSRPETLQDLVRSLNGRKHRKALGFAGELGVRWWTRERLGREIRDVETRLRTWGVGHGDRILLWAPNSPEWAAVFLAAAEIGAVTVPVDPGEEASAVDHLARQIQPCLALAKAPPPQVADSRLEPVSWMSLGELFRMPVSPTADPRAVVRGEDPVVTIFTSGTTGTPREVTLTHGNLAVQLQPFRLGRAIFRAFPFRALSLPPSSHVLGLVVGLLLPLYLGMPTVTTGSLEPHRWARIIREQRLSVLVAVPRLLQTLRDFVLAFRANGRESLAAELDRAGPRRGRLLLFWRRGQIFGRFLFRVLLVGGAELPTSAIELWRRAGLVVVQGYGLTETAAFVSISRPFGRPGSLGRPVGDQELRVAPDGELLVRGPNLSPGLENPDGLDPEGFLATGDLVRMENGILHFVGRKSEVIITAEGLNVPPSVVESELLEQPGVSDAAAVPWHGAAGVEIHAVLVLAPDGDPATAVRLANRRLGPARQIAGWTVWPTGTLPRGHLGKLRRREILDQLPRLRNPTELAADGTAENIAANIAAKDAADVAVHSAEQPIPDLATICRDNDHDRRLETLAQYLVARARHNPAGSTDTDISPLVADLGLGSLDVVQLLGRIEQGLGDFSGPPPVIRADTTVQTLENALRARVSDRAPAPIHGPARSSRLPAGQPRYARFFMVRSLRRLVRSAAVSLWRILGYRAKGRWHGKQQIQDSSFLIVAEPHRHWLDAFAVYQALHRHKRRRLMVVTNRDFHQLFEPRPDTPWTHRIYMAGAYYLVLPFLFCFSILAPFGRTREGLLNSAKLIGHGYRPITFPKGLVYYGRPEPIRHDPGLAWLAIETGVPLLPVVIEGNFELGWRWRRPPREMTVHFGDLIHPQPGDSPEDLTQRVETAWSLFGVEDEDSG